MLHATLAMPSLATFLIQNILVGYVATSFGGNSMSNTTHVPCPSCGALPGEPCTTGKYLGLPYPGVHGARLTLASVLKTPIMRIADALSNTVCSREIDQEQIVFENHDFQKKLPVKIAGVDCVVLQCVHCGLTLHMKA